jgi:hypothetical protein
MLILAACPVFYYEITITTILGNRGKPFRNEQEPVNIVLFLICRMLNRVERVNSAKNGQNCFNSSHFARHLFPHSTREGSHCFKRKTGRFY